MKYMVRFLTSLGLLLSMLLVYSIGFIHGEIRERRFQLKVEYVAVNRPYRALEAGEYDDAKTYLAISMLANAKLYQAACENLLKALYFEYPIVESIVTQQMAEVLTDDDVQRYARRNVHRGTIIGWVPWDDDKYESEK